LVTVAFMPLGLLATAFISRYVPGRWRPLRLLWFAFVWLVFESIAIVAMFFMWVASGFGWKIRSPEFQNGHYRLMAWFLRRVVGSARFTFGLETVSDAPLLRHVGRPILVLARHAGPGDSLLLVDALMNRFQRHPRIVLKETLQWDPAIDILLNRVPNRFISTKHKPGEAAVTAIGELAETLGEHDALVIFPEGGNFTPARWERAIDKLRAMGLEQYAARAADMKRLLPPKPAGVLAAIAGAPDAAIVLVGHAGLERMDTVADVWAGMRMDITVRTRTWTYLVSELPTGRSGLETWLYDGWEEMNAWLDGAATDD
jgi:1-acyl-sn-glycerol-3-phosphate acyltransferase